MSKYDNIKTAADLIKEVQMHGLSLNQEDLNRAADIFGHSTVDELVSLANDIGRENVYGEPDPKGTWSSGRRETRSTFYQIASNIWSFEDVTRFWNQHTNPEHVELVAARKTIKNLQANAENDKKSFMDMKAQRDEAVNVATERLNKVLQYQRETKEMEFEIMSLKAKLYDLMTASK